MSRITTDQLRHAVLDRGSFVSWDSEPLAVPVADSYARELAAARAATGADESVQTGEGRVFGRRVAVVACEFDFLGGSIGVAAAERITVFDAIHDQAQPARVLQNIYRALRPGGVLLMVDIKASSQLEDNVGVPLSTYLYTTSLMHCMTVSLALDGAGLGTVWGRQLATSMLADAGFTDVTVAEIESDVLNNYYIARK